MCLHGALEKSWLQHTGLLREAGDLLEALSLDGGTPLATVDVEPGWWNPAVHPTCARS